MTLPKHCPEDLAHKLEALLSYRETNAAEIWGAVREWMVENGGDIASGKGVAIAGDD